MIAFVALFLGAGPAAAAPSGETCLEMRGGIYEIVLPDAAGMTPGDAPRRPYLVLADTGPSLWVNGEGSPMTVTWTCVPDEITLRVGGNTSVARRKDAHYELNGKPLVRWVANPENAARCDALRGQRWSIDAPGQPVLRGAKLGRNMFQSELEGEAKKVEAPGITFSEDGKTLEEWDGRIRRESVPYSCDAAGVRFAIGSRLEYLTWTKSGMGWFDRSIRPPPSK